MKSYQNFENCAYLRIVTHLLHKKLHTNGQEKPSEFAKNDISLSFFFRSTFMNSHLLVSSHTFNNMHPLRAFISKKHQSFMKIKRGTLTVKSTLWKYPLATGPMTGGKNE